MKKILLIGLIIVGIFLVGCSGESGSEAYNHLQNLDPASLNTADDNTDIEVTSDPRCIGQYSAEDISFRDLEKRAVIESNIELCYQLPADALEINCPDQVALVYYSKDRCLEYFNT